MTLKCDCTGLRIDLFLSQQIQELSRSAAQKLLECGAVTRDGKAVKKSEKTTAGSIYEVALPQVKEVNLAAQDIALDVAYEDADVIVINKPKGMVVHPAAGHWEGTLVNALMHHCKDNLSGINVELRPGIVHRIDKDTSGLLIVAKNDFAHQHLSNQLKTRTMHRTYEAIVCGSIRSDTGTICAPIGRHPADRKKMAVTQRNSREATTHFEVLGRYQGYTHLRLRLETGRTHQIRVHLAWQSHPILGDMVYGHKKPELGQHSQCLHARTLTFLHPRTEQEMTVTSDLPDYFTEVLAKLRKIAD